MFTGLVKTIGSVIETTPNKNGRTLKIWCGELSSEIKVDDSISVNGVCQTARDVGPNFFIADTIAPTLRKTNLGSLKRGDFVNLELALRASDRLGGHFVQGHVQEVGKIIAIKDNGLSTSLWVSCSREHYKYILKEGPIALHGVSLTVSKTFPEKYQFEVSIIPHTWKSTALTYLKIGDGVNLEFDVLAMYVENLLKARGENKPGLDLNTLKGWGY